MAYDYAGLLDKFGRSLGMGGLTFDEGDCCSLLINGEQSLVLRKEEAADRIVLTGVVAYELPDPIDYSLVSDLLEHALSPMNGAGPAVGLDRESGMLVAYVCLPMNGLDEGELAQAVGGFLGFRELMAAKVAGAGASPRAEPMPGTFMAV